MRIFVFGSNQSGIHGAGAAKFAVDHHGAQLGKGEGIQGTSYAIPTKDYRIDTLSLTAIQEHVNRFLEYVKAHPELEFDLTPVGCGLAGYRRNQIRPLFGKLPNNVHLTDSWNDPDIN